MFTPRFIVCVTTGVLMKRFQLATLAALLTTAACSQGADDDPEVDEISAVALDGQVDFADYMLPNCSGPSTPQYIAPQVFRTVPLGGNRFAVVKNRATATPSRTGRSTTSGSASGPTTPGHTR